MIFQKLLNFAWSAQQFISNTYFMLLLTNCMWCDLIDFHVVCLFLISLTLFLSHFQSIDNGLWWYNNVTVAFYLSLSLSHFFEARRKDFWQMFIHHLITLTLFIVSWIVNAIRGSSLVNFVHDIADVLLEAGKATNYAKYEKTCSVIFSLFSLVWIVTRLGVFSRIVYVGVTQFPTIHPKYPMYYIFTVLNISLLVLHIIWTYMIYKVAVRMFKTSAVSDVRSSSEESESDSEEQKVALNGNGKVNGHHANGHTNH